MDPKDIYDWLAEVHYKVFMVRKDYWYRRDYMDQDARICVYLSDLRKLHGNFVTKS